jgi:hypothetical protein
VKITITPIPLDMEKVKIEKKHAGENCLTCTRTEKTKCFCCAKNWEKPRCLICKRTYDESEQNRGFHENPQSRAIELCSFADGKIRMGQMVSEALSISPEAWKSLRVAIPVKRSKRSYKGDHYHT